MIEKLNFYISDSLDPYKNLAIEKYLSEAVDQNTCILYLWQNEKTVVIGRNQNPWAECRCRLAQKNGIKIARRMSGGGAVFHDVGNLNFTFLYKTENYDLNKQLEVIKQACFLAGIQAELSGRNDILVNGKKFSGNAFYNSGKSGYHHGTILICSDLELMKKYLTPPKAKLEAKGVKSVKSRTVNLCQLNPELTVEKMKQYMLCAFKDCYDKPLSAIESIDDEYVFGVAQKYSQWEHIYGKTIPFTLTCEKQFTWGHLVICMQIKEAYITCVAAYTDSMNWTLSEDIEKALTGCRLEYSSIVSALEKTLDKELCRDVSELIKGQCI